MGRVYKARDLRLGRIVALKFLLPDLLESPEAHSRFLREGRALSALSHPNVAVVYEVDNSQRGPFLALEYLPGGTLRDRIRTASAVGRRLALDEVFAWGIAIAEGLSHSHHQGIVHRDIKSNNIMFDAEGRPKLTDFGLAKVIGWPSVTMSGTLAGTVAYMSPEQAAGGTIDSRSDLYSLGVVLYEMATGRLPFTGNSPAELIQKIGSGEFTPPGHLRQDLLPEFDTVVATLLAKEPTQRYASGDLVSRQLHALRAERQALSDTPTVSLLSHPLRAAALPKTRRWWIATAGALAVASVTGYRERGSVLQWVRPLPKQKQVAVLPFRNIGGDASQQAFCDGVTEILTTDLSRVAQLSVVPSADARRLESAGQARREFGVNLVIDGSVQRRGDQLRLIISVINAETLREIAAELMDWTAARLPDLEESVVSKVGDLLNVALSNELQDLSGRGASAAYEPYLQGRGFLYRYDQAGNLVAAEQRFEEAVRLDPKFAAAHAGLAETHLRIYRATRDAGELQAARAAADQAVSLNPRFASAHLALGGALAESNRPEAAVQELETALKFGSLDPAPYRELARLYQFQRRFAEAEQTYQRAITARPGDWQSYNQLAVFYSGQQRDADAERMFRRVIELSPDNHQGYRNLGTTFIRLGRNRDAEAMLRKALALRPTAIAYSNLGALLMLERKYADALQVMEQAARLASIEAPNNYRIWGNLGDAYWLAKADPAKSRGAWEHAIQIGERQLAGVAAEAELLCLLGKYSAKIGDRAQSVTRIDTALMFAPESAAVHYQASLAFALLGDQTRAFAELSAAVQRGYNINEIRDAPELALLQSDPRFHGIIKRDGSR